MNKKTTTILQRVRRGNSSAKEKIGAEHFRSLISDAEALGTDAFLEEVKATLSTSARRASKPKSDFEVEVDRTKTKLGISRKELLHRAHAQLKQKLGDDIPPKSKVDSLPKFVSYFERRLGKDAMFQAIRAVRLAAGGVH